ncbi:MAG: ATP-dependent Clp protease ATP-binding subunit, partial [Ignavibacteriaceae bacterium]|nr:ATP-dependent Clp protease ATP-binding subunit [Ignavibacteriaceae bacterium]
EFLNRLDDQIVFRNLTKDDILKIIDVEIKDLLKNIHDNKLELVIEDSARNFLADKGYDPKFGARPLKRAIQNYIEDPLSEEILRGSFKDGTTIVARHVDDNDFLVFMDESSLAVGSDLSV